jgi:hypothetical protein
MNFFYAFLFATVISTNILDKRQYSVGTVANGGTCKKSTDCVSTCCATASSTCIANSNPSLCVAVSGYGSGY